MKQLIKTLVLILTLVLSVACNTKKETSVERKQLFDFNWKFSTGNSLYAHLENFDDQHWKEINLPHDWSIQGASAKSNPSQGDGGFYPMGTGWYRKKFTVPQNYQGKKVSLYFEGVYMNAEVYVNEKSIGRQAYGYTSFEFDMAPYLKYGEENTIAVRVDNSKQKNSRWYSGSGIYRHVWLKVKNPIHVKTWGVAITTEEVSNKSAKINVTTTLKNDTKELQELTLITKIYNKKEFSEADRVVANGHGMYVELKAGEEKEVTYSIETSKPMLWSVEKPNLYEANIAVYKVGNKEKNLPEDVVTKTFGIRTIDFSTKDGFLLNGKKILLNGGCVHHDNGALGAAAYDRAEERKVELLKKAGFNAVRTSHNPPSEAFLNACDQLGMLVIDEAFDGWKASKTPHDYASLFDKHWKHDLESMVIRDRNHPSIIMWSIGNEIIERTKPEAVETAKMLANAVRHLDTTRPVTSAMTTWGQGWEIFDPLMAQHDVAGYNYQLHRAESDHQRVPSRIIVQTESYPKDAFENWNLVQKHNYVIGDFVWTAMDYIGESGIGRYVYPGEPKGEHWEGNLFPWHGAYCGDIDLMGWRKPISHYRSMLYNTNEKLYMAVKEPNPSHGPITLTSWAVWPTWESWTWPGYEGKEIEVELYSKYPKVRLYVNGKSVGDKETIIAQKFKAVYKIPYTKGEIKAVGLVNNKEVETVVLQTAKETKQIKLIADRNEIKANGQDLSFVTVHLTDAEGIVNPNAENELTFKISGQGEIVAVDNANLKDTDLYVANKRKAWKGKAMVVVKSTQQSGDILLEVSAPNLKSQKIKISSK
ncbi:glycoside hydrolase family 2 TIM barrel-domain containing protein [Wenyingzhuangia sp. IMCC45467]